MSWGHGGSGDAEASNACDRRYKAKPTNLCCAVRILKRTTRMPSHLFVSGPRWSWIRCHASSSSNKVQQGNSLRRVGRTDLWVPDLCFGTMLFGQGTDYPEACALLDECMEHGVNFFDSAEMYPVPQSAETQGRSEEMLGRWMRSGSRSRWR